MLRHPGLSHVTHRSIAPALLYAAAIAARAGCLDVAQELLQCAETDLRLAVRASGFEPPPTLAQHDLEVGAMLTRRGRHAPRRRPFLEAEIVSAGAAARGSWQRQRGTSRAQRPQARRTSRFSASRDGLSRSSDDLPLARLRGFAAASTRMVQHLERRRAAMRLA